MKKTGRIAVLACCMLLTATACFFVAWQMMATYRENSLGLCWAVHDEELLSTVSITSPYDIYNSEFALGYATAEVTVYGGMIDVDLSPKSAGAIVEVWVDHLPSRQPGRLAICC